MDSLQNMNINFSLISFKGIRIQLRPFHNQLKVPHSFEYVDNV